MDVIPPLIAEDSLWFYDCIEMVNNRMNG